MGKRKPQEDKAKARIRCCVIQNAAPIIRAIAEVIVALALLLR